MPAVPSEDWWINRALDVVPAYVATQGAVVWPEVEARLGETDWVTANHDPTFPATWTLQPHILHTARTLLVAEGVLVPETVTLSGRAVTAYLDGAGLAARSRVRIQRTAAAKRRLYRTFLAWAGNNDLCGRVAEEVVDASLRSVVGTHIWLDPHHHPGRVSHIGGRPITVGGPLDAAGFAPYNLADPRAGLTAFAVEVKNVRSWVYPWSHEAWDLLAKLGDFPDVVPILVARRLHLTTFRMFKDLGAIGSATYRQWFFNRGTDRASIDATRFGEARAEFGFHDAELLADPAAPQPIVVKLFSETVRKNVDGQPLIQRQAGRWRRSAPIVARYPELRSEDLTWSDRRDLMAGLAEEIEAEGLLTGGGWASPAS